MSSFSTNEELATDMASQAVTTLRAQLRGELIQPGDARYGEARRVYNAMIDKHPALIARCADVADVIHSVNFARDNNLLLAVRGGGHNGAGLGSCDDGLVIDLGRMKGISTNPTARTTRVEGGCVWGDVDHATHAFGMATPSGIISTTGVGGLTLGGGHGYLTRKYGLTIDNLLAVDIVLEDGSLVTASADENADLFWAVRGGGGNFGVVTSFLFKLHPVSTVIGGPMFWDLKRSKEILAFWREFMPKAPEELSGFFAFVTVPPVPPFPEKLHLKRVCAIVWCYSGQPDQAEVVFKPVRQLAPVLDAVGLLPYPVMQSMFDALYPPGLQWFWRADFFKEINDAAIDLHVQCAQEMPQMHSTMHIYPIDGAPQRVGKNDTAFSYRDASYSQVIVGVDPDPQKMPGITQWVNAYWDALHPYSAGGAYVNFMMEEGQGRVQATYRDNYRRLAEIKVKYDPNNLFRVNQNIRA